MDEAQKDTQLITHKTQHSTHTVDGSEIEPAPFEVGSFLPLFTKVSIHPIPVVGCLGISSNHPSTTYINCPPAPKPQHTLRNSTHHLAMRTLAPLRIV